MNAAPTADAAIKHPEDDLLGLAPYARTLAQFVRGVAPPFTIGIYGEWGAGKTTFVNFLEHYLTADPSSVPRDGSGRVLFVPFTAWPHKTADELWRALVLMIAKRLYDVPDTPPASTAPPAPLGPPRSGWRAFLRRDALVLREATEDPDPYAAYHGLVARLDDSMVAGIGRSVDTAARVDPEQTVLTVMRAAMAGLGALSPIAGAARSFLKLDGGTDAASLLQRNRNEAARERIESMGQFRSVMHALFDERAAGRKVVVFIDDLDRCMPDVALDLLEATKIFMGEAPCIFVVAADEQLIGQGLRLRFKDVLSGDAPADAHTLLTRKGQEYFEKIIQLRITVPSRTAKQTQTFLAALYPQWMAATDMIEVAVGSNPRRLRQYCAWLGYKRLVERGEPLVADARRAALLERLVELETRHRACFEEIVRFAREGDAAWTRRAGEMERIAATLGERADFDAIQREVTGSEVERAARYMVFSAPLVRLFRADPPLSSFPTSQLLALAVVAEARPSGATILSSSDGPFARILQTLARTGDVARERMLEDDVARLITLRARAPAVFDALAVLAGDEEQWPISLYPVLDSLRGQPTSAPLVPTAQAVLDAALAAAPPPSPDWPTILALLAETPAPSEMNSGLIRAVAEAAPMVAPLVIVTTAPAGKTLAQHIAEEQHAAAGRLLAAMPTETRSAIDVGLELREWAARHCFDLRASTKINALERRWAELAALLQENRAAFSAIESQVQATPEKLPDALARLWTAHDNDEALREFLQMRPLVRDIDTVQLRRYFQASQSVAEPTVAPRRPAASPISIPLVPVPAATPQSPPQVVVPTAGNVELRIELAPNVQLQAGEMEYAVTAMSEDLHVQRRARLDPEALRAAWVDRGLSRASTEQLLPFGRILYDLLLAGDEMMPFLGALARPSLQRLLIHAPPRLVDVIPWEALAIPAESVFPAMMTSVVRATPGTEAPPRPITAPLRVLGVLPEMAAYVSPTPVEEQRAIDRVLEAPLADGRVQVEYLWSEMASQDMLRSSLGTVRPNVLHLAVDTGTDGADGGSMLLAYKGGKAVASGSLTRDIAAAEVDVVILHGADSNDPVWNTGTVRLARDLASAGVRAVVASVHGHTPETRLLFIREFYRAFLDGVSVEGAVLSARRALIGNRLDWSAYALFSARRELESVRMVQGGQRPDRVGGGLGLGTPPSLGTRPVGLGARPSSGVVP